MNTIKLNIEKLQEARKELMAQFDTKRDEAIAIAKEIEALNMEVEKLQSRINELRERGQEIHAERETMWCEQIDPLAKQIKEQYEEMERLEQEEERNHYLKMAHAKLEKFKAQNSQHPAIMEFMSMVIESDIEWFNQQRALYRELGYKKYMETDVSKAVKSFMIDYSHSIHFESWVIDLVIKETKARIKKLLSQVESKVGNIQECNLTFNHNDGLDGLVIGDKAQATVRTILAGGYNIQRLHYRTLIKAV